MKKIYLFCLPGGMLPGDVIGYAVAEDGCGLASHLCSSEYYARHDMGLDSDWKHDIYKKHYPDGYELEWVSDVKGHSGLQEALRLNKERAA